MENLRTSLKTRAGVHSTQTMVERKEKKRQDPHPQIGIELRSRRRMGTPGNMGHIHPQGYPQHKPGREQTLPSDIVDSTE